MSEPMLLAKLRDTWAAPDLALKSPGRGSIVTLIEIRFVEVNGRDGYPAREMWAIWYDEWGQIGTCETDQLTIVEGEAGR